MIPGLNVLLTNLDRPRQEIQSTDEDAFLELISHWFLAEWHLL